jgi:hypothetical protein
MEKSEPGNQTETPYWSMAAPLIGSIQEPETRPLGPFQQMAQTNQRFHSFRVPALSRFETRLYGPWPRCEVEHLKALTPSRTL